MTSTDRAPAPRPGPRPSRSRLLRRWAIVACAYILLAAAVSTGPLKSAIEHAQAAPTHATLDRPPSAAKPATGPIPDALDTPAQRIAKAVGLEAVVLLAPPLLLLWFGWDVWFALAGFFPALNRASRQTQAEPAESDHAG